MKTPCNQDSRLRQFWTQSVPGLPGDTAYGELQQAGTSLGCFRIIYKSITGSFLECLGTDFRKLPALDFWQVSSCLVRFTTSWKPMHMFMEDALQRLSPRIPRTCSIVFVGSAAHHSTAASPSVLKVPYEEYSANDISRHLKY